ncbi:endonuclease [soil metagenome]
MFDRARAGKAGRAARKRGRAIAVDPVVKALLDRHGRTHADELRIPLRRNTPSPLFRLLCAALLASARISADLAVTGARALSDAGWTTAEKMAGATWEQRVKVLNDAGYARYDESTSRLLGETADLLSDRYGGDLRRLRDTADRDLDRERELLKECKGIGDVGADIFLREVQLVWDEVHPFADDRALRAARALDLGADAEALTRHVSRGDYPRLVAALVRTELAGDADAVREAASG